VSAMYCAHRVALVVGTTAVVWLIGNGGSEAGF